MITGNNHKVNPLWDYPIWQYETNFNKQFNEDLLDEIYSIAKQISNEKTPKESLWDYNTPALSILKGVFTNVTNTMVTKDIPEIRELNYKFKCDMAWPNVREPDQDIELHAHPDVSFAATYYVKAEENCGDLICYLGEGKIKRIKPKVGTIVIVPFYMLHEIEPNKSKDLRVSISTDFTQIVDKTADNALVLKSWCDDMLKVKDWNSVN
jgi:hypothetical protein